jgi:hypothetical protein
MGKNKQYLFMRAYLPNTRKELVSMLYGVILSFIIGYIYLNAGEFSFQSKSSAAGDYSISIPMEDFPEPGIL